MSMTLLDALGRPLDVGDTVILPGVVSPLMIVREIRPDLSGKSPAPMLIVTLSFQQQIPAPANYPARQLVLVLPKPDEPRASGETPSPPADETPIGPRLVEG